ncbi:hypothetical protein AN640_04770 [Candidatus Epulonipiscium fishelsonii]|uniref:Uncharacterized protein n=1 Tax=Candidatus Epulonipiscium fishelsonii TaxID=77094 RepID=A0ACC8XIA2_9FIRM|nr:hypothetical protein AN640_04770 [Epulopiscium sp. SCG-D08WGA-EpuloA1]OON92479.1 MAG: hypothetical protein ATN32_09635 [Epulopiscium sp. AS2M-Bin002]
MKTKDLALGGILTALTIIILYISTIVPTSTMTFYGITAIITIIAYIRASIKTAILVYTSSSILCFLFLPPQTYLMYILFFGHYGILKGIIEGLNKIVLEWILKLIVFNTCLFLGAFLFNFILNINVFEQGFIMQLVLGQVIFVICDYALTLAIDGYYKYFSRF